MRAETVSAPFSICTRICTERERDGEVREVERGRKGGRERWRSERWDGEKRREGESVKKKEIHINDKGDSE